MNSEVGDGCRPADLTQAQTYSVRERPTKVRNDDLVGLTDLNPTLTEFLESLPRILKADELRAVVEAMVRAHRLAKPVVVGIGGHVVKCGLNPLLIRLMERGAINAVCMNGGASIHDFEIATLGATSEDVAASLKTGMFGMVEETAVAMNRAIGEGTAHGWGMGYALGAYLREQQSSHAQLSVLAAGHRLRLPVMVHVAVGADTIHMHPSADGAAFGETTFIDFRRLVTVLKELGDGGVYLNIGSSVLLPEVFLKALNLARNLASDPIERFATVNMDMVQHYRPLRNVVQRPTQEGTGAGYTLTGHHEIMVPLLFQLVLAALDADRDGDDKA